jgi:hypothetical protein
MKRMIGLAMSMLLMAPISFSADLWPFGKDQKFNLGTSPSSGGSYELNDGLGFIRVDAYDGDSSRLTLTLSPGSVQTFPDTEANDTMACETNEPYRLAPGQACAFWGKNEHENKEYHFQVSWSYEEKKNLRVVVIRVRKATIKLAK